MNRYVVVAVSALALAFSGCMTIKIKLAEAFINSVVTGKWEKPGADRSEYYTDNWECQRDTSKWDQEMGMVFDLKEYYNCMVGRGWSLKPYRLQ